MKNALLGLVLATLLLSGCASLDQNECVTANWQDIGYEDGISGYSTQRLSRHRKACAKHGITPDSSLYKLGHKEGVPFFCVAERGLIVGSNGSSYPSICSRKQFLEFSDSYNRGKEIYKLNVDKKSLDAEINVLEHEIQNFSEEIEANEGLIVSSEMSPYERRTLHTTNKQLRFSILSMQDDIYEIEQQIIEMQEAIERLRN